MNGLWTDVWFYIGITGLLIGIWGAFRLRRAPREEPAPPEAAPAAAPEPVRAAAPAPAPAPAPAAAAPAPAGNPAVSPAVLYLRNLKAQMEYFRKEVNQLRTQLVDFNEKHERQFEALLNGLSRLQEEIHAEVRTHDEDKPAGRRAEPASRAEPAPRPDPSIEKVPSLGAADAPRPVKRQEGGLEATLKLSVPKEEATAPLPTPQPEPEPAPEVEAAPEPAPEPAAEESASEPDVLRPAKKGPVWPV